MATVTITTSTTNYVVNASDTTLINLSTIGGTVGIDVLSGLSGDVVVNAAAIAVGGTGLGVRLSSASNLTNQSGGTISAYKAVIAYNDPSTVTNYGVIAGSEAVLGAGVQLINGGALTNEASAVVSAYSGIIANAGGTVANSGTIQGNVADANGRGVWLLAGGVVANLAGGTISGFTGIYAAGGATVTNGGAIAGEGGGDAVLLAAGVTNRVVLDPGAVFSGTVDGRNTAGSGAVSTLELASGGSAGTLSGLGTQFVNFGQVTIDSGAAWTLSGANTVAAGGTLSNAGRLYGYVALGAGALASNAGTISASSGAAVLGFAATAAITVSNLGVLSGELGTLGGYGAVLDGGGTITNQAGATIGGYRAVVAYNEPVTVTNDGTILGNVTASGGSGGMGVRIAAGGTLANQSGATIAGYTGVFTDAGGTVLNAGTILGNPTAGSGVVFGAGGYLSNSSGGSISGGRNGVVGQNATVAITVVNQGVLSVQTSALGGNGVALDGGGQITNQSGGAISGYRAVVAYNAPATVTNEGAILGNVTAGGGIGVRFAAGGTLANQTGATVAGYTGAFIDGGGTVLNAGTILGNPTAGSGLVFNAGGYLSNSSGGSISGGRNGVIGNSTTIAVTINNQGVLVGELGVLGSYGVALDGGGQITNQSGGTISGYRAVVAYYEPVTVTNDGAILGNVTAGGGIGVRFAAGGTLANQTGATIAGYTGAFIDGGGTVLNAGMILDSATAGSGLVFNAGGYLSNSSGGSISGGRNGVIGNSTTIAVTINNQGVLAGESVTLGGYGAALEGGGQVTNQLGGTISGYRALVAYNEPATVTNDGAVLGNVAAVRGMGVRFAAGGTLANQSGATIVGYAGVVIDTGGTVLNGGTIIGNATAGSGVLFVTSGYLSNSPGGSISGGVDAVIGNAVTAAITISNQGALTGAFATLGGYGVVLDGGGTITNQSGGTISGYRAVVAYNEPATVTNDGIILGNTTGTISKGMGVRLGAGGMLTNQSGATIAGYTGVFADAGGTVVNAGTVVGVSDAVLLVAGAAGRVIIDPGGVFVGTVDGGNAVDATAVSTLELASGVSAGTLSGLGSQYVNFSRVTIDAGASWTFVGSNTLAIGTAAGTVAGVYLEAGASITNTGTLSQDAGALLYSVAAGVAVTNTGVVIENAGTNSAISVNGNVSNAAGAIISGWRGVHLEAAANTLFNAGTIIGTGTTTADIILPVGGTVSNAATGTISAFSTGIYVAGASGAVFNAGDIFNSGTSGDGIQLKNGGFVSNAATGTISSVPHNAINISGGSGTVMNAGLISNVGSVSGANVALLSGGLVSNASTGTITSPQRTDVYINGGLGTVVNAGLIQEGGSHAAVVLQAGGIVTNQLGGTIIGGPFHDSVYITVGSGTVINDGLLTATASNGVLLEAGGTVVNQVDGTISGGTAAGHSAVYITGALGGVIDNAGLIHGIALVSGGTIVNHASGIIEGNTANGIVARNAAVTVTNAGTIAGVGTFAAVGFAAGNADRLIVDPGAVFVGAVNGGNTVGASVVSTLELASGASAGTLSGLGSQFIDFANIAIDAGGTWTLASAVLGANYTITDAGALTNTGSIGSTVTLLSGAVLTNAATAVIDGGARGGVYGYPGGTETLVNFGSITASGFGAINMGSAVVLTNASGGTIHGGAEGIYLGAGGTIINDAGGTIYGGLGIGGYHATTTIINAGSIGGSRAVFFSPGHADRLIIDPGASFYGSVNGGGGALELASGAGSLSGLGSQFYNFAQTTIDAGASWALTGANTVAGTLVNDGGIVLDPSTLAANNLVGTGGVTIEAGSALDALGTIGSGQTISFYGSGGYLHLYQPTSASGGVTNFAAGDTIDLAGINPASVSFAAGTLSFTGGAFPLDVVAGNTLQVAASGDGSELTALCFCAGTMLLTPGGERRVQELAVGDLVTTASGEARPIAWIGTGKVLATRGHRNAATPVIVRKDAIAAGVPSRDLHVSKGHSLYIDDVLIPVEFLVNYRSILWDDRTQEVELYHVELATHDVLIADGAAAESYRDDGNRWLFDNANSGWDQPAKPPCAPVLTGGHIVDAVWRRLLDRAGGGPRVPLTDEADLHVLCDGERIDGRLIGDSMAFTLPRAPRSLRLVSRAASPAELGLARDPRQLGVAVKQIQLWQGRRVVLAEADAKSLVDGYHDYEPQDGIRWTNGDAAVPEELFAGMHGAAMLLVKIGGSTCYLDG